jgi:hypothetical protein
MLLGKKATIVKHYKFFLIGSSVAEAVSACATCILLIPPAKHVMIFQQVCCFQ